MKFNKLVVLLFSTFIVLVGFNAFAQDMDQIREKVDATNATLTKAVLEDDLDIIISLYVDDCWS